MLGNSKKEAPKTPTDWSLLLLERRGQVTSEQIESFRSQIEIPRLQQIFDMETPDQQALLVTLHNLSDQEKQAMRDYLDEEAKRNKEGRFLAAGHELNGALAALEMLKVKDPRRGKFAA